MWNYNERNIGEFVEVDHGCTFTYREVTEHDYNPYNLPHMVDVLDGIRFATVKKTVAYVCVDEDSEGKPVMEKWQIKKHNIYS